MKLALAALVYLLIALILSVGILLTIAGKPWLLIIAFAAYVVAFARSAACRNIDSEFGVPPLGGKSRHLPQAA